MDQKREGKRIWTPAGTDGTALAGLRRPGVGAMLLALVGLHIWVQNQPFFWDTVQLAGKHAGYYFSTNFEQLLLPEQLDSGHPPTFSLYLAVCWKLFGRSLPVSHWAMSPWTVLCLLGSWRVVAHWTPRRWVFPAVVLLWLDPVWLGQAVLVSPDIWVMAGFWWAVVGLQERQRGVLLAATCLLALTSTRGMMLTAALYGVALVWHYLSYKQLSLRTAVRQLLPFLPAALLGGGFLVWHYTQTGWIGYHAASPWAPSFERVGWGGFAKNLAVLGWRVLDFGRVAAVLALGICGGLLLRRWKTLTDDYRSLLLRWAALPLVVGIFTLPSFLMYQGLSGHRYLLPLLQWVLIGCLVVITHPIFSRHSKIIFGIVLLSLLFGHRWIYPRHISQQWDASLAHQAYLPLRRAAFAYLDEQGIPYDSVGTVFPEIGPRNLRELGDDPRGLTDFRAHRTPYIWYSNLMNDFGDETLDTLADYPAVARWNSWGIELVLYRRPATNSPLYVD